MVAVALGSWAPQCPDGPQPLSGRGAEARAGTAPGARRRPPAPTPNEPVFAPHTPSPWVCTHCCGTGPPGTPTPASLNVSASPSVVFLPELPLPLPALQFLVGGTCSPPAPVSLPLHSRCPSHMARAGARPSRSASQACSGCCSPGPQALGSPSPTSGCGRACPCCPRLWRPSLARGLARVRWQTVSPGWRLGPPQGAGGQPLSRDLWLGVCRHRPGGAAQGNQAGLPGERCAAVSSHVGSPPVGAGGGGGRAGRPGPRLPLAGGPEQLTRPHRKNRVALQHSGLQARGRRPGAAQSPNRVS